MTDIPSANSNTSEPPRSVRLITADIVGDPPPAAGGPAFDEWLSRHPAPMARWTGPMPAPANMSIVSIYCTGKGMHRRFEMLSFVHGFWVSSDRDPNVRPYWYSTPTWVVEEGHPKRRRKRHWSQSGKYTFACRRCRRAPQITARNLDRVLDGLVGLPDGGVSLADISYWRY